MVDPISLIEWAVGCFLGSVTTYSYFAEKREKKKQKQKQNEHDVLMSVEGHEQEKILAVLENNVAGGLDEIKVMVSELSKRSVLDQEIAERAFNEAQTYHAMNEAIFNAASIPVVCCDQDARIVRWNDAAALVFGWRDIEVIGKTVSIIVPDNLKVEHVLGFERYRNTGESHILGKIIDINALHRDGHIFPVKLSVAVWHTNDGHDFFCAYITPI